MLLAAYAESMSRLDASEGTTEIKVSSDATTTVERSDGLLVVAAAIDDSSPLMFSLEVPLGDAEGFWHPNARRGRTLPADWAAVEQINLVSSTPVGVLYDKSGSALLAFAADETVDEITMRFGVCEETNTFVVHLELAPRTDGRTARLAILTRREPWTAALTTLRDWLVTGLKVTAMPHPAAALEPVYSTWYTFAQDLDAAEIEAEAGIASSVGCGSVFIDDGWALHAHGRGYAGCGDWLPDLDKFPDLARHVQRLHGLELDVVLWVAPLLLGRQASDYSRLASLAPHYVDHLDTCILDPRRPEVRDQVVATCLRLMRDYGLDGLKIDFLDQASVYQGTPSAGDTDDTGVAMLRLLDQLRSALREGGWDAPLLEFRQPYVGPSLGPYSNILRVGDCPGDTAVNRASIVDLRLLSFGPVVHADMMMWDGTADVQTGARPLLNAFFSVPQISMRLAELRADQLESLTFVLGRWRALRDIVLGGELEVGLSNDCYPVIQTWNADGDGVLGIYSTGLAELDPTDRRRLTVLNGTRTDSVVLDLVAPVSRVRIDTYGADGSRLPSVDESWGPGLRRLPVPACGLAEIQLE